MRLAPRRTSLSLSSRLLTDYELTLYASLPSMALMLQVGNYPCIPDFDHEWKELHNKSGTSTNIWLCENCGRVEQTGIENIEDDEATRVYNPAPLVEFWTPNPRICSDILTAISHGCATLRAVFDDPTVRTEVRTKYSLNGYLQYLEHQGLIEDDPQVYRGTVQDSHRFRLTAKGKHYVESLANTIREVDKVLPRESSKRLKD